MNKDKETSSFIMQYIDSYALGKVKERGLLLYRQGKVHFSGFHHSTRQFIFTVKGSKNQNYKVKLSGVEERKIHITCNCPYDWGGICKHEVAVLMYYLDDILDRTLIDYGTGMPLRKKEPLEIKKFHSLDLNYLEKITETDKQIMGIRSKQQYVLQEINFDKDRITFVLVNSTRLIFVKVEIFKKGGKIWISDDENIKVSPGKLKPAESFVLKSIARVMSEFPDVYFNHLHRYKQMIERQLNIPENSFDFFFQLKFDFENGLTVDLKETSPALIHILNKEFDEVISHIRESAVNIHLKETKSKAKSPAVLRPGFVLHLYKIDDDYISPYDLLRYVPVKGKPNASGSDLIARVEILDRPSDYDDVIIEADQRKILKLIERFDEENDFELSKRIFHHMHRQPYVYGFFKPDLPRKFRKGTLSRMNLSNEDARLVIKITDGDGFIRAVPHWRLENELVPFDSEEIEHFGYIVHYNTNNVWYHIHSETAVRFLSGFPQEIWSLPRHGHQLFERFIKPLSEIFEFEFDSRMINHRPIITDYHTERVYLSEEGNHIIITPKVVYDDREIALHNTGNFMTWDRENNTIVELVRNREAERLFLDRLAELHPSFEAQKTNGVFSILIDDFLDDLWFYGFFEALNEQEVEVYGINELKKFKYSPYKGSISVSLQSDIDWFDVNIKVRFGNNLVRIADLKKAVTNHQKYIRLKDGSVGILPEEWLRRLKKYFRFGRLEKDKIRISKRYFAIIEELFDRIDDKKILKEITEKRKRLQSVKQIQEIAIPSEIKAQLRDYQKEGYNWMHFLDELGWGGILADDMGLGKTLQVLVFLQSLINQERKMHLIIVPTTLLFNWKKEIEKFAPHLKVLYHYGPQREQNFEHFDKYDLIITTYGTLSRDLEKIKDYKFDYVILDESQAIKNPTSLRYKAVNLLQARNRLALTGTPIENSTFDLYAQMNFVNPGFFGSMTSFREQFARPVDRDGDEKIAAELQKLIRPFVLRRTKEQVAKELPPKTEDVIYCEMHPGQRRIYETYLNEYRLKLLKQVETQGLEKSKLKILEALTRLRQICDAPALVPDLPSDIPSGKIKVLMDHIRHRTARHKVLIFSQFVKMLHLIREELERAGIPYEYLDGKTPQAQRELAVRNFQTNEDVRIFLVSLKAGGTGLNLTAADYVYLIDPWWNPAVENQAIDRTHRIGQSKSVFAYRMIARDSIEEKILQLQHKKKRIAGDIIQADENLMQSLTVDDIKTLFS